MRKTFLRLVLATAAVAMVAFSACKGKDESIQKALTEKVTAASATAADLSATVKDGVVTINGQFKDDAAKAAFESSVKSLDGVKSVVDNSTVAAPPPPPAPVEVATTDALTKGATDAIKDFPGVKAEVKDSIIFLSGEIKRSSLKNLMQPLSSLHAKKIDRTNLIIK
ncbi:MAG: BON domain-containing protein [Bacteroidota bacterium]|nr:BON domain-containing protein [Bacteroidota bacterium]